MNLMTLSLAFLWPIVLALFSFGLLALVLRWAFRVNDIVSNLEKINEKLERLAQGKDLNNK